MSVALAAVVAAGIAAPHLLPLGRVPPVTAVVLWLGSLALRALACALVAVYLIFFVPRTGAFDALTHWCWEAVFPLISGKPAVEGHTLGDAGVLLPALVLAVSLFVVVPIRIARSARAARRLVERCALTGGPGGSLVVGGSDIAFAVAGLARPRIVVSVGALACLDDEELRLALDHERAHIIRRHRFVMLLAATLRAVGRPLPGSRHAVRELGFHLERDADRWALRQTDNRSALASAISKAASAEPAMGQVPIAGLRDPGVRERIDQLLEDAPRLPRPLMAALHGLAIAMVASALVLATLVPSAAVAGARHDPHHAHHDRHCDH